MRQKVTIEIELRDGYEPVVVDGVAVFREPGDGEYSCSPSNPQQVQRGLNNHARLIVRPTLSAALQVCKELTECGGILQHAAIVNKARQALKEAGVSE